MTNSRTWRRMTRDYLNELEARERITKKQSDDHDARTDNPHNVLHSQLTDVSEEDINPHGTARWQSPYTVGNEYKKDDLVLDDGWTMIANKDTTDRAAPQKTGAEYNVYTGTGTTNAQATAKQIIFGNRYPSAADAYITGYRIYLVANITYRVFLVADPIGTPVIQELQLIEATTSGWVNLAIDPVLVLAGATFDLVCIAYQPDGTPVTWSGDWNYLKPNNPGIPAAGEIVHANRELGLMDISYTDDNGGDRTAELQSMTVGDTFSGAGGQWSIQTITQQAGYITFGVAPASQGPLTGVEQFTFETVTATPIDYMEDANWWPTSSYPSVQGLLAIDTDYSNATLSGNAYGTDIYVQNASISPDWDVVASSNEVAAGSGGGQFGNVGIDSLSPTSTTITTGVTWTEIFRAEIPAYGAYTAACMFDAYRMDAPDFYTSQLRVLAFTGSVDEEQIYELGPNLMGCRAVLDGNDLVLEVRGMPGQDWSWRLVSYFRSI